LELGATAGRAFCLVPGDPGGGAKDWANHFVTITSAELAVGEWSANDKSHWRSCLTPYKK
jgi:hypothetical protein